MTSRYTLSRWILLNIALGFALLLSACGGGGGGKGSGGTTSQASTYSVSATAGAGGSISPTSRNVTSGQTTTFTLTANAGYRIERVSGCNGSLAGNIYTTGSVTANCSVTASFVAQPTHAVTTQQSTGGSVSPNSASVIEGATASFTITPDTGYRIASVTGCGGTLTGNNFTTAPVSAACIVNASFELQQFTINTEVIGPGGLAPTTATVSYGQDAIFYQSKIVYGHNPELLPGCNARWDNNGGIKATAVTENCTVRIRYVPFEYEITAVAEGDGSISPSKATAHYGDELRFTIKPGAGNRFSFSKGCDGYFDSKNSVFIIPSVTETCQLHASFHDERYVYFADPLLEQKVREALAIAPEQPILPSEMETLTSLEAGSSRIKQLDGLEYAKNLKSISLEYNQISNLRPLANLALQSLSISGNPITDSQLAFLSHSPLQMLTMDSTKVTDLSPLAGKARLNYLSIQYTQITDLSPIQNLAELEILQAMHTSVADINPLLSTGLRKLMSVSLGGCLINNGFSRASSVVDALKKKGIFVTLNKPREWDEQKCPANRAIQNVMLSGNLSNGELELNWQVTSDDPGPWRCEVHLNLDSQLPRLPIKVIDNCHTQNSIRLTGFNLNEYTPSLRVDTGIYNGRMTSAPANIVNANKPQTASLHSYDWAQTLLKTNPLLVAGKVASLRLHVTAQSSSPVPKIEVYAELAGKREAVPVTPPASLPTGKRHGERNQSFYSQIPAHLMQPGLKVDVLLEGNKQLTLTPEFSKVNGIHLRVVPMQLDGLVSALPSDTQISNSLTRYWPLGDIQVSRRAPYQLSKPSGKNSTNSMLNELADLRVVENGTAYYYGYYDRQLNNDLSDGLGFMRGMAAVGVNDRVGSDNIDTVLAHELGHNFSLPHAPCGFPSNTDIEYPYNFGAIGSYGTDQDYTTIFNPELKDVMGYCGGDHVSDYNYEKAQDYLDGLAGQPQVINTSNAATSARKLNAVTTTGDTSSLYLRIAVTSTEANVVQQIALPHLPALQASNIYRARVEFVDGSQQELPASILQLGHNAVPGEYQLQLVIPTHEQQPIRFTLLENQKILLEHTLTTSTTNQKVAATQASNTSGVSSRAARYQLQYRNNEICVDLGSSNARHVNLLWHHADGVTALALNETASNFCRTLNEVPAGEAEVQVF